LEAAPKFSELDCLRRLKQDDARAFDALFRHYSALVYRFSYSYLKSKVEAEEIVQDCFLKIWEKRYDLHEDAPLKGYLFTIAHHAILNQLRRNKHQHQLEHQLSQAGEPSANSVASEVEFAELEGLYLTALEKLPPQQRRVFLLSRQQGLSYAEIAAEMSLSVKTVESHMSQALKSLRRILSANGEGMALLLLLALLSLG
jgi:RNA polymerase sigma-70 factor (family 1)